MRIRELRETDISPCADILCSVYNNELWMCRWTKEVAESYLRDFFRHSKFVGYGRGGVCHCWWFVCT